MLVVSPVPVMHLQLLVALFKNPDLYYFQKGLKSGLNIHDNSLHFYVSISIKKINKLIPEGKSSSCLIQPCDCLSHKELEKGGGGILKRASRLI